MSQGYTKGIPIATDPTMALNSDQVVPSQAAVVAYVASQVPVAGVTSVNGAAPIAVTPGPTPTVSMPVASAVQNGYLSTAVYAIFNNKQDALVAGTGITIVGNVISASGGVTTNDAIAYAIALG